MVSVNSSNSTFKTPNMMWKQHAIWPLSPPPPPSKKSPQLNMSRTLALSLSPSTEIPIPPPILDNLELAMYGTRSSFKLKPRIEHQMNRSRDLMRKDSHGNAPLD
jgi:hypothetical protein